MSNEAKTYADLVDPARLILIRQAARKAKVDPDLECQCLLSCKPEDLSKSAARHFILHLESLRTQAA